MSVVVVKGGEPVPVINDGVPEEENTDDDAGEGVVVDVVPPKENPVEGIVEDELKGLFIVVVDGRDEEPNADGPIPEL